MDKMVVDDWGQCRKGVHVRRAAPPRRQRAAERGEPPRRAGPDRGRAEAGPRARRRDHPVLAPRPVASRDIALGHAMLDKARALAASARGCGLPEMAHGVASTRMYNATPAVAEAWQRLFVQVFADLDWPVRVDSARLAGLPEGAVAAARPGDAASCADCRSRNTSRPWCRPGWQETFIVMEGCFGFEVAGEHYHLEPGEGLGYPARSATRLRLYVRTAWSVIDDQFSGACF